MGRKVWGRGATVTAADINTYLMDQSVMTFATAAARTSAIPSPTQGMVTWRNNAAGPIKLEYYNGSSWVAISFSSPAQTVQGQSSLQTLSTVSMTPSSTNTWSSWTSVGTSPASTSYMTEACPVAAAGWGSDGVAVVELSLDGGSTVWKRCLVGIAAGTGYATAAVMTPRSCAASSTIHMRFKATVHNSGGTFSLGLRVTWTTTAPAVTLSTAESLWEGTGVSSSFGTWTTLGTVGAAHRLVAFGPNDASSDGGLATGSTPTVICRTGLAIVVPGHNRAVPSGSLKVSGTNALVYVLTEPV